MTPESNSKHCQIGSQCGHKGPVEIHITNPNLFACTQCVAQASGQTTQTVREHLNQNSKYPRLHRASSANHRCHHLLNPEES